MAIQTFAAIDVGSFEVELGLYEISSRNGIREVDHVRHVIALGRDTYDHGKISYQLVEELCRVLADFSQIMKSYRVQAYKACATSALRDAKNNQIILDQIKVRTGIDVDIISNSEQRLLSYKAIAAKDQEFNTIIRKGTAIVDIGSGSIQLSLFDKDSLVSTQNLPLGVMRLQQMVARIPADNELHRQMMWEIVENELFTYKKMYLKDREIKHLIGIGDNSLFLFGHDVTKAEPVGDKIPAKDISRFYERLCQMSIEQLEDQFSISEDYARLMLPGAVIYKQVLEITGAEMFWVPGIRLCDGIAAEYGEKIRQLKFKHNFEEDILAAAKNMAKRYKCYAGHNQALDTYACSIFDAMRKYHGMGGRDKLLLRIAVHLHSCGKFISMKSSNDCAYNIIMSTEIIGLSHLEREIIANVVRYNIRDFDYNQVKLDFTPHSSNDITIKIAKLTAILRLANSMDRSHRHKLLGCKTTVKENQLVVLTDCQEDISLEKMSFEQRADFFEEIYGIRPVLRQKRRT